MKVQGMIFMTNGHQIKFEARLNREEVVKELFAAKTDPDVTELPVVNNNAYMNTGYVQVRRDQIQGVYLWEESELSIAQAVH